MGDLYGTSILIDDPFFGRLTDDAEILRQRGKLALATQRGALDGFPEHGFVFEEQVLRRLDATARALLPLEVRTALEQEPSIAAATVEEQSATDAPGGGVEIALRIDVQGHGGDGADFTVAVKR